MNQNQGCQNESIEPVLARPTNDQQKIDRVGSTCIIKMG